MTSTDEYYRNALNYRPPITEDDYITPRHDPKWTRRELRRWWGRTWFRLTSLARNQRGQGVYSHRGSQRKDS